MPRTNFPKLLSFDGQNSAQWSKRGGEDAINSNDSFMPSKWYQIEGLIKRNSNLAKKI